MLVTGAQLRYLEDLRATPAESGCILVTSESWIDSTTRPTALAEGELGCSSLPHRTDAHPAADFAYRPKYSGNPAHLPDNDAFLMIMMRLRYAPRGVRSGTADRGLRDFRRPLEVREMPPEYAVEIDPVVNCGNEFCLSACAWWSSCSCCATRCRVYGLTATRVAGSAAVGGYGAGVFRPGVFGVASAQVGADLWPTGTPERGQIRGNRDRALGG